MQPGGALDTKNTGLPMEYGCSWGKICFLEKSAGDSEQTYAD
jgi:hypothetical protein